MKLEHKVCVITGAAAGIGQKIAERYASEGAKLVLGDIAEGPLTECARALEAAGAEVIARVGNVADKADAEALVQAAVERFGRLDVLVNNAGVLDGLTPIAEASDELFERVIAVNLKGPFYTCRKAVSYMLDSGGGVIINLASLAGIRGGRGGTVYTMSKHAVIGLTESLAFYYAERGIRANAICPGGIDTDIHKRGALNDAGLKKASAHFKTTPRPGKPDEIASCAVFLASEDASYVNGATLVVDGGWTAH